MRNTEKRVKVYLTDKMLRIYNYCVCEQDTLGKMLVEYLDIQYAYKYLIQQKENRDELSDFRKNKDNLTEDFLNFDYRRKRKILARIFEDLEYEYKHLLKIIKTDNGEDNTNIDNSYNWVENSKKVEVQQQQEEDDDYEEDDDDDDDEVIIGGTEPDPDNPGYTKDGDVIW